MAIIPKSLFGWEEEIDNLGDLLRLQIVLETLPDKTLMHKLFRQRGKGRNDFPVRAMWNLIIAGVIFEHKTIASLLRELKRNVQLAHICGFGFRKLPATHNMSRFINLLLKHEDEIKKIGEALIQSLYDMLENFGKELAIDSKWLLSAANRLSKRENPDGRSETDATFGKKEYSGVSADGKAWEKIVTCFGFKINLVVDAVYEIPIAYSITDAAASDVKEGKKLIHDLEKTRPGVLKRCNHMMGDKGYDDTSLIELLKENNIKAIIDKRTMWKAQTEKEVPGYADAYYDEFGNVYCYSQDKGSRRLMAPNGYENKRDSVRFKCPALAYGINCPDVGVCKCKNIRVHLSTDPRIFTQVQRESYKWKRHYKMRTAVERVNSRLDGAYGFEDRRTRGLPRTKMYVGLAMLVMLALAVWCVKNDKKERIRSLFKVA